jgi:membrane protein
MDAVTPAKHLLDRAASEANDVRVPLTRGRLGLVDLGKRLGRELSRDHVDAFASSLAYKGLLALFPFSILIVSLLGVFGAQGLLNDMLDRVSGALPTEASTLLRDQVFALTDPDKVGVFTFGAIVGAVVALWALSGAMRSVMESMNVMYGVEDRRGLIARYVRSIVLAVIVVALFAVALALVVGGPDAARAIAAATSLGDAFVLTGSIVQWPVLVALVMLGFALVYWAAPAVDQRFRFITPGTIVATVAWLAFSLAFSAYANHLGSFNATYGALAGVVVLLLYLHWSSFLLLVGAELNQVIEAASPDADATTRAERGATGTK